MISVVICTYNRADKLGACLDALVIAKPPQNQPWELIVVDNNSSDATRDLVHARMQSTSLPLRYAFEREQGLSPARNRGIVESRGDIIAFTDDDCIVDPNWLNEIESAFAVSTLDFVGGRAELYNKEDRPVSIRTSTTPAKFTDPWHTFTLIPGCNMIFRRRVYDAIGGFDKNLGPGASGGAVADDADFVYRAFRAGFNLEYNPSILIFHDHGRRTDQQVAAIQTGYLKGRAALYAKHIRNRDFRLLKLVYWELARELKAVLRQSLRGQSSRAEFWYIRHFIAGFVAGLRLTGAHPDTPLRISGR